LQSTELLTLTALYFQLETDFCFVGLRYGLHVNNRDRINNKIVKINVPCLRIDFSKKSNSKRFFKCSLKNICTSNNIPYFSRKELFHGLVHIFIWFNKLHFCPKSETPKDCKTVKHFSEWRLIFVKVWSLRQPGGLPLLKFFMPTSIFAEQFRDHFFFRREPSARVEKRWQN
jgi:hypothetical protein